MMIFFADTYFELQNTISDSIKLLTYGCHRIIHVIFYRTFDCQIALKCQNNCLVNRADECYVLELIQAIDKKSLEIREKKAIAIYIPIFYLSIT